LHRGARKGARFGLGFVCLEAHDLPITRPEEVGTSRGTMVK
jgi:hypothetical protein